MQTRTVLRFGVLFSVVFAIISLTSAGEGKSGGKMEKFKKMMTPCDGEKMNVDEFFKHAEECKPKKEKESRRRRSPNEDSDDKEGGKKKKKGGKGEKRGQWVKHLCSQVCNWKKCGLLTEAGQFDVSGAMTYVDAIYPESKRAEAKEKLKECAKEIPADASEANDCKAYQKFKGCSFKAHAVVCNITMPAWGKKGGKGGKKPEGEGGEEE